MKSNKGFTLVELIVVIAILLLLSTLAVNAFSGIMDQARIAQDRQAAAVVASALNTFNSIAVDFDSTIGPAADNNTIPVPLPAASGANMINTTGAGDAMRFTPTSGVQHTLASGLLPIGANWSVEPLVWGRITGRPADDRDNPHIAYAPSGLAGVRGIWEVRNN